MKKQLLLVAMAFFSILFVSSCQKDEEIYSCDPEMDRWAKNNYESIQNLTTTEFLNLEYRMQKVAYVAMGGEQRHKIWMDKLYDILQMEWSQEESNHIESLISFIGKNQSLFDNSETQQDRDQFELFMYRWIEKSEEKLCWERETIHSICGDPNKAIRVTTRGQRGILTIPKVLEFMTERQASMIKTRSESGEESAWPNCSCSQTSDWCDIFGEIPVISCNSNNYNCKIVKNDCGLFWKYDCDGICKAPIA